MGDELHEVVAVYRGIIEAIRGAVPVRIMPATAAGHDRATTAGRGQASEPALACHDSWMDGGFVEAMAIDIQSRARCAVIGELKRIYLLDKAIGLNDQKVAAGQAQRFGTAMAAIC